MKTYVTNGALEGIFREIRRKVRKDREYTLEFKETKLSRNKRKNGRSSTVRKDTEKSGSNGGGTTNPTKDPGVRAGASQTPGPGAIQGTSNLKL